jgi:uncharacterized protein
MGGMILNALAVFIGSGLGMLLGNRLSERVQQSVMTGLGLVTLVVAISNALTSKNIIIPLLAVVLGVIIGEALRIDVALERFADQLHQRLGGKSDSTNTEGMSSRERFITGFVTSSLIFCVGPLTIVGSIQDGMGLAVGFQAIVIKSVLDFFASMAFAASFGVGVMVTSITIVVVQGALSLVGIGIVNAMTTSDMTNLASNPAIIELTATGGIVLMALGLVLLDIKKPRVANFLPALLIAPLMVVIGTALGINLFP